MTHKWKDNVVLPALASSFLGRVHTLLEKSEQFKFMLIIFAFVMLHLLLAIQALIVIS